ncbi:MAG: hypothetical protein OHK0029_26300 [Armatimonadaceae bacterium]
MMPIYLNPGQTIREHTADESFERTASRFCGEFANAPRANTLTNREAH